MLIPQVLAADQEAAFNKTGLGRNFHFYSQLGSAALKGGDLLSKFIPKLKIPTGSGVTPKTRIGPSRSHNSRWQSMQREASGN